MFLSDEFELKFVHVYAPFRWGPTELFRSGYSFAKSSNKMKNNNLVSTEWGYGPINNQVSTEWCYDLINQVSTEWCYGPINNQVSTEWSYGPINNQVST